MYVVMIHLSKPVRLIELIICVQETYSYSQKLRTIYLSTKNNEIF